MVFRVDALAGTHARLGDRLAVAAYLGGGDNRHGWHTRIIGCPSSSRHQRPTGTSQSSHATE